MAKARLIVEHTRGWLLSTIQADCGEAARVTIDWSFKIDSTGTIVAAGFGLLPSQEEGKHR